MKGLAKKSRKRPVKKEIRAEREECERSIREKMSMIHLYARYTQDRKIKETEETWL